MTSHKNVIVRHNVLCYWSIWWSVWVCALACALVSAQITFSRDWTGGKRSPRLPMDCQQFTRLCRHFVHELKQTLTSEMEDKRQSDELDRRPPLYDDE